MQFPEGCAQYDVVHTLNTQKPKTQTGFSIAVTESNHVLSIELKALSTSLGAAVTGEELH